MASAGGAFSFTPPQHEVNYLPMNDDYHSQQQRSASPASPSKAAKFWPFNRSRSSSPNIPQQLQGNGSRSRKTSANSFARGNSPTAQQGFVVRNVTRQPGGVSVPSSPVDDASPSSYDRGGLSHAHQSPRRITLESDDDEPHHQLQYRRSKSKPVGAPVSLGVPPGGPGGGLGYGTSKSSHDGRPEPFHYDPPSPLPRPSSPGGNSITAGGFQKSLQQGRGRSPRKSPSQQSNGDGKGPSRSGSAHSKDSSGKVFKPLITPGPKSFAQQQGHDPQQNQPQLSQRTSFQGTRPQSIAGPREFPGAPARSRPSFDGRPTSPLEMTHSPRQSSPLALAQSPGTSVISNYHAQGQTSHSPGPHTPGAANQASRGRKFSFGLPGCSRKQSFAGADTPPPSIPAATPLQGLPSPVDIPYGRSPGQVGNARSQSRDPGADTDYSYENNASPFGSVSPAGSPGFLAMQASRGQSGSGNRGASPGGSGMAGKWFKGIFGKSPQPEENDQNWQHATMYPNAEGDRTRENSPMPGQTTQMTTQQHQALAPRQPPNAGRRSATLPKLPSEDDVEAVLQKRESMRQARKIVDAERRQALNGGQRQDGFDPAKYKEFKPKQAIDDGDFEERRRKSPPGRKPVPRFVPSASEEDGLNKLESSLTPAQKIIQETRSMHLARESLESQKGSPRSNEAVQAGGARSQIQRGFTVPHPAAAAANGTASNQGARMPSASGRPPHEPQSRGAPAANPSASLQKAQPNLPNGSGAAGSALSPGAGPLPMEMTMPQALQEMMIRFYRFERYSVPLIRSLETRLLDIERDAMLAFNPQSGARANAETASQHEEMDRWVGQMTRLMKHEVAQLKAATKEIREGRDLVSVVAKGLAGGTAGMTGSASMSSLPSQSATGTPVKAANVDSPISTRAAIGRMDDAKSAVRSAVASTGHSVNTSHHRKDDTSSITRQTNISSSSFRSAVPHRATTADSAVTRNLVLPAGSRPALGKDEGKYTSPIKTTFSDAKQLRERSTGPNGRKRYTSALGEPMQNGRISPGATSPLNERRNPIAEPASPSRWADDQRKFNKELVASPALSDHASIHSGMSSLAGFRREMSVQDRLKALVDGKSVTSRSSSVAGSVTHEQQEEEKEAGSEKIGDDYKVAPEVDGACSQAGSIKRAAAGEHGKEASGASMSTNAHTIRLAAAPETPVKSNLISSRSSNDIAKRASAFLDAPARRTTNRSSTSSTKEGSVNTRPTSRADSSSSRRHSVSPGLDIPRIPTPEAREIKTSPNASQSIRDRTMSYLSSAEATGSEPVSPSKASNERLIAEPVSPSKVISPASWLSSPAGGGRISPSKLHANRFNKGSASPTQSNFPLPAANRRGVNGSATTILEKRSFPTPGVGPGHVASLKERVAFFDSAK